MVKELNELADKSTGEEDMLQRIQKSYDNRLLINKFFLHAADISNPTKPFGLCREWALRVMDEFFSQGDRERELGIPIQPLNDRSKVNIAQSQLGFIEFVVSPLEMCKIRIFPVFRNHVHFLINNMVQWGYEYCTKTPGVTSEEESRILERCHRMAERFSAIADIGGYYIPQFYQRNNIPSIPNSAAF
jgi:hypothetical protein